MEQIKKGYKQTEIGIIPEDWDVVQLSEISIVKTGPFGAQLHERDYVQYGTPIITVEHLSEYGVVIDDDVPRVSDEDKIRLKQYILQENDIVFSRVGSVDRNSLIRSRENGWLFSGRLLRIRPSIRVHSRFLSFYFHSVPFKQRVVTVAVGQTMASLNTKILNNIFVCLPSLKEQQAIADALSEVDEQITSLDALIAKKRDIKQGTMQNLLTGRERLSGFEVKSGYQHTEVGIIPEDWNVALANNLCIKIQDGTHFSPQLGGSQYLYITSKNIGWGSLDISTADRISEEEHRKIYKRCDVKKGDVLLTKDGANTGNATINWLSEEFSLLSSVVFLRFNPDYDSRFYLQYILSNDGQSQIMRLMSGNAITRLTLSKIKNLVFPVPPTLKEQQAIANILSDMDIEIESLEAQRTKTITLKQGMMQELLTGKTRLL